MLILLIIILVFLIQGMCQQPTWRPAQLAAYKWRKEVKASIKRAFIKSDKNGLKILITQIGSSSSNNATKILLVEGLVNFDSLINFVRGISARIELSRSLGENSASSLGILVLSQLSLPLKLPIGLFERCYHRQLGWANNRISPRS